MPGPTGMNDTGLLTSDLSDAELSCLSEIGDPQQLVTLTRVYSQRASRLRISYSNPGHSDHVAANFPKVNLIFCHPCWPWVIEACGVPPGTRTNTLSPTPSSRPSPSPP